MKYIKLYEGFFDIFKRKKYDDDYIDIAMAASEHREKREKKYKKGQYVNEYKIGDYVKLYSNTYVKNNYAKIIDDYKTSTGRLDPNSEIDRGMMKGRHWILYITYNTDRGGQFDYSKTYLREMGIYEDEIKRLMTPEEIEEFEIELEAIKYNL